MRDVLTRTLHEDIEEIETALAAGDATRVQRRLHSLSGGLATIRATALARTCGQWEVALQEGPLDVRIRAGIDALLVRLRAVASAMATRSWT